MDIYDRIPYSAIVDRKPLTLPDGGRVEMDMGETRMRIDGQVRTSIVLFGEEGINPCGRLLAGGFPARRGPC